MNTEARRYRVRGRVQGVGFRFFVERVAGDLRLRGWVRNCADGSVEVLAEGELEVLDRFEEALRRGPRMARVDQVISEPAPVENLTSFDLRF